MRILKKQIAISLVLIMSLVSISSGRCQDVLLSNIIIANTRDDLLLYLNIKGAFNDRMNEAVLNGVTTTFSIHVIISRVRNLWPDKEIADILLTHTIKYDALKKIFTITRSNAPQTPVTTTSFDEARKLICEVNGLKIATLSRLEKGKSYQIQAKARLSKVTLPFYLHYVLIFVSLWDFETDWTTIDFVY